jgi:hypothetical protein
MKLTKLSNGAIILSSGIFKRTLSKYSILQVGDVYSEDAIIVKQGEGQWDTILLQDLEIEVEPNPSFFFSGSIGDLFEYLTENIFESNTIENFNLTPGNSFEITYYSGVTSGNPSGSTTNIENIIYKSGATVIATKTLEYDVNNNILKITVN